MGNWTTISNAGGGTATYPDAPNVLNTFAHPTTVSITYSCPNNASMFQFNASISIDTGNAAINDLKVIRIRDSVTDLDVGTITKPNGGWTSPWIFKSDDFVQDPGTATVASAPLSGTLTFYCFNEISHKSPSAVAVAYTVQASLVTGFASAAEVGTRYIPDPTTLALHLTIRFVPTFNGNQVPQMFTYWIGVDQGSSVFTYTYIGYGPKMMTTVQTYDIDRFAPKLAQAWRVAARAGTYDYPDRKAIAAAALPAGTAVSSNITVAGLALPAANLITVLNVSTGAGGSFPYNQTRPDGTQFWSIDDISYSDVLALTDPNAFFARITAEDLDSSSAQISPVNASGTRQSPFAGTQVVGLTEHFGPLMGDYLMLGLGATRSGNIAYVRLRVYVCNRVDETQFSFTNALCAVLQTGVGGGLGYLDVLVASGGGLPSGAIPTTRIVSFAADVRSVIGPTPSLNYHTTAVSGTTTVTPDLSTGNMQGYTLAGNVTVNLPTNGQIGQEFIMDFIQDGTGGRTITLNASYSGNTDLPFDLSPGATTQVRVMIRPGPAYVISGVFTTV